MKKLLELLQKSNKLNNEIFECLTIKPIIGDRFFLSNNRMFT